MAQYVMLDAIAGGLREPHRLRSESYMTTLSGTEPISVVDLVIAIAPAPMSERFGHGTRAQRDTPGDFYNDEGAGMDVRITLLFSLPAAT
ncbi:MAG TPA: hypothetical protein VK607_19075 [Kofleriaceae bacterium]|nr:hypothetical protein [Kofleriaceae bacterium]